MRIDVSHAVGQAGPSSTSTSRIRDSVNRLSLDSLTPPSSSSPTSTTYGFDRTWDRKGPSPLPSPILLHPPGASPDGLLGFRESDVRQGTPSADGAISPALSSSSKNDLFFGGSTVVNLPTPPRPLARDGSIGRGTPSTWAERGDRSVSTPTKAPQTEPLRSSAIFDVPAIDISLSGKRVVSQPESQSQAASPNAGPSKTPNPVVAQFPAIPVITRRESQQLAREHKQIPEAGTLNVGDTLVPVHEADDLVVGRKQSDKRSWRLERRIGEGAFSSVWAAAPVSGQSETSLAAVKVLARSTVSANARTRISFVREVEVLRHIAHPGIVSYLSSFSTPTHHCLVLERLEGGELFELVSDQANRDRMLLPGSGPGYEDPDGEGFVRRLFGELCKAVGWLHEVHAVHRDIKLESESRDMLRVSIADS